MHVLGRNGEVLVAVRGDGAPPHTMENSQRKAYTSRTFRIPSGEFVQRVKDNPTTGAVHLTGIITAQGASRIKAGDDVTGAVGVPERQAARRTKRAQRPASTRSPTSSINVPQDRGADLRRAKPMRTATPIRRRSAWHIRSVSRGSCLSLPLFLLGRGPCTVFSLPRLAGVWRSPWPFTGCRASASRGEEGILAPLLLTPRSGQLSRSRLSMS